MPSVPADTDAVDEMRTEGRGVTGALRRSFIKGLAILLPDKTADVGTSDGPERTASDGDETGNRDRRGER